MGTTGIQVISVLLIGIFLFFSMMRDGQKNWIPNQPTIQGVPTPIASPTPTHIPAIKILEGGSQVFQTFNNCGPASLSMALSYYGIVKNQTELGLALRPYQNSNGDNDDKSVSLDEMGAKAEEFDLIPIHRPGGSIQLVKQFIALGIPVIVKTWLTPSLDIGHYRIIKGYDDTTGEYIQDDSYQGKNLRYTYIMMNDLWHKFGYEYLVLIPRNKFDTAKSIVGDDIDPIVAWKKAVNQARIDLSDNPNHPYAGFNLSVALYHTGDYQQSVTQYESVQNQLPFRTLWYQMEPLLSYYEIGKDDIVLSLSSQILEKNNRAYSEIYILRGNVYIRQGNIDLARKEFEQAVIYNTNLKAAKEALDSVQKR